MYLHRIYTLRYSPETDFFDGFNRGCGKKIDGFNRVFESAFRGFETFFSGKVKIFWGNVWTFGKDSYLWIIEQQQKIKDYENFNPHHHEQYL